MNSISYIRAAQVGVIAIAADLILNQGRTISGIALGIIGNFGLEICKTVRERGRRISPPRDFSPDDHEQGLKIALGIVK